MKGHWHLLSFAAIVAILTTSATKVFCVLFILWIYCSFRRNRITKKLLLGIVSFLIIFSLNLTPSIHNSHPSTDQRQTIRGLITSEVNHSNTKSEFLLKDNKRGVLIKVIQFKQGKEHNNIDLSQVKTGASCEVNGRLEIVSNTSRNPGQFDYGSYLKDQLNVEYQLSLEETTKLSCKGSSVINQLYDLRNGTLDVTGNKLSSFSAGWLHTLILGEDSNVPEEITELFQRWNLSHLLAISGLHVGLLVACLYFVLIKLQLFTREKAQWILVTVLPLYPILGGGAASVWRASLMTLLAVMLIKMKIRLPLTDVVSIIFLFLVIIDQNLLYQLGFQFSFLVTFALALSRRLFLVGHHNIFVVLRISFLSLMVLLPIQLYHFYYFNPLSVLVNLFYVPYFSFFVIPMMFLLLLSFFIPPISNLLDSIFVFIHEFALHGLYMVDRSFYLPWVVGKFPEIMFLPYYVVLILFMKRLTIASNYKAFLYGCFLVIIILTVSIKPYVSNEGRVTVLDVGQGDSIVIELPHRKGVFLVDAAGSVSDDFENPSNKVFKQVIKPYLYSQGISAIDAIILSHSDLDHTGSMPYIIEQFQVDKIITSKFFVFSHDLKKQMVDKDIELNRLRFGQEFNINGFHFFVVSPENDYKSTNNNSLVLYTKIGGLRWLFTGDIDKSVEGKILKTFPNLTIDVLKVAHHGSKTSTSSSFLEKLDAQTALISVGENNRYGHPNSDVIDQLKLRGITILRTDANGAIQYNFEGNKGTFHTYLPYDIVKIP